MIKKWFVCILILVALAIPASAAVEIIPTAVGNRWEFDSVKMIRANISTHGKLVATMNDGSAGTSVYEVLAVDDKAPVPVYEYQETNSMQSLNGTSDTDSTTLKLTNTADGLRIISTRQDSSDEKEPDKQAYDPPLLYYINKAASGASWDVGTMRDRDTKTVIRARGGGRETVTVPAGTFKDCVKVVYSSDDVSGTMELWGKTFTITSGRNRGIYWVADGIGIVKELEVATSTAETLGSDGKPVTVEAATCTVNELKPGYKVNNQKK